MKESLLLLAVAAVVALLITHHRRRGNTRFQAERRAGFEQRIEQARQQSPDELVAAAAEYLRSNLRFTTDQRRAWVVAEDAAASLTEAAQLLDVKPTRRAL